MQPSEPDFESGGTNVQAQLVPHAPPDLGDMRAHDIALSHLNARGFIQFHPLLAQRLDSFKAAIFLGHALYWSKHLAHTQPQRKGWFFMSASQWTQATGLSTREQTTVRAALVGRGLLLEALAGRPAVMHYKVNLEATATLLGQTQLTWACMTELFRSSVRFYKPLADICGSVGAGLYLSFLLQRQSFALRNPPIESSAVEMFPGEFVYRPYQARIALCLGIKAQRNARDKLKASGFIREGRSSQEMVATRVNLAAIASCLQAQGEKSIRKNAPRKRAYRATTGDLSVVQTTTKSAPAPAAILKRADSHLPQRQLNLFSPLGLISNWPVDRVAEGRLAPQDDAATLVNPVAGPTSTPAGLVMSLFAAGGVARPQPPESAATSTTSHSATSAKSVEPKLSTSSDTSGNHVALLSNAIRPFVEPNLPFCRNYKEQGISRYFQTTTTTPPVDNFSEQAGRRRVEKEKKPDQSGSETAVHQKIAGNGIKRPPNGIVDDHQWGGSFIVENSLKTPQKDSDKETEERHSTDDKPSNPATELILPARLDVSMRAGVLSTITQAPIDLQQPFLDELAGHLALPNKTIHNPIGWLHSLIRRNGEGYVALALAPQVAAVRLKRQQYEQRMAGIAAKEAEASNRGEAISTMTGALNGTTDMVPEESEIKRSNLQRLQELKQSYTSARGGKR